MMKQYSDIKPKKKSVIDFGIKENGREGEKVTDPSTVSHAVVSCSTQSNENPEISKATIQLVSAMIQGQANEFLKKNKLFELLRSTHTQVASYQDFIKIRKPAVPIESSVHQNYLLSLVDGQPYTVLSKHVKRHGMTVDEYKRAWGLPDSYPTVAPAYSKARRMLAQKTGLGRKNAKAMLKVE